MYVYILVFYNADKEDYKIECYEINVLKHIKRELEKGAILIQIEERKI